MRTFCFFFLAVFLISSQLISQTVVINEVMSSNQTTLADEDGDYPDWIEIYNPGSSSVELAGFGLSDEGSQPFKWIFPQTKIDPGEFLLVFASDKNRAGSHTNFKIKSSGETLYVTHPNGSSVDSLVLGDIATDISYGRQADGSSNWFYFREPTPIGSNNTQGYDSVVPEVPTFSVKRGLYQGPLTLSLSPQSQDATIYYTLDGTDPTESSFVYSSPLQIDQTTVLRARIKSAGLLSEEIKTHTYILNKNTDLAIISITTNPDNLWDSVYGIYSNYESDKEIPIFFELFEPNGIDGISKNAGMKIHGGWTRQFPQKSFAIFAREKYGPSSFRHRIFPELPFVEYESFILRNSGGDFESARLRDALQQNLVDHLDIETQAYRPAVVYLNGVYWGILNIREKLNEHYVEAHHGISKDNLDMLENHQNVVHGDATHYISMTSFIASNNMSLPKSYEHLKTQIDMDNYLDYMASQIYFANTDWPGWNLKYWRPKHPGGKWRWMLYDLDDGFGLGSPQFYGYHNMFDFVTTTDGPEWPNPPWSTFLFRKLLENGSFKEDFLNRFADYLNTIWQPDIVVGLIDEMLAELGSEMQLHLQRWQISYEDWQYEIDDLKEFAEQRVDTVRVNIISEFGLTNLANLTLNLDLPDGGIVRINKNIEINETGWNGIYFQGIPVDLIAVPNPGYQFVGWTGDVNETSPSINISMNNDFTVTALFAVETNLSGSVVINEINYNSADHFDPKDWVEFYNDSNFAFDLSNWTFRDSFGTHEFIFPQGSTLAAHDFLVLCRDTTAFLRYFPTVKPLAAEFDFGLDNAGEPLYLFNTTGQLVDYVPYDDIAPWPIKADGNGSTLILKSPLLDNSKASNWLASPFYGSPGLKNDVLTDVKKLASQMPSSFVLEQNYPNPFNPTTTITFRIPVREKVLIRVFDITGREVATLLNKMIEPGEYHINWNAGTTFSSGIYFYQISSKGFSQTRTMLLLK